MNMHGHMSGQSAAGQMPNQQQQGTGMPVPPQMQMIGAPAAVPDQFEVFRMAVRKKIYHVLQRQPLPVEWVQRLPEIAKRVEEWVFKSASSKEEYMNKDTLERRLQAVIKNLLSQAQPQGRHTSHSATTSTMIPTPGMSQGGSMNPSVIPVIDSSIASSAGTFATRQGSGGGTLPSTNGAANYGQTDLFSTSDGTLPTYQLPSASASMVTGNNNIMSSIGLSRNPSQMIPTPGLNNTQSTSMIGGGVNTGYTSLESTTASQQLRQKQFNGSQSSRLSHNLGGQLGTNMRSNLQFKYDFSNGVTDGGLGGNNALLMDGSTSSDGYLGTSTFGISSNAMQSQVHQLVQQTSTSLSQQMMPATGDGYGMADMSSNSNLYTSAVSGGSMMNQNIMSMQIGSKTNPVSSTNQEVFQPVRQTAYKPTFSGGSQKMDYEPSHQVEDNLMHIQGQISKTPQLHQRQQPSLLATQFVQHPYLQKKQTEPQANVSMQNGAVRQPLLTADMGNLMHELGEGSQKSLSTQAPGQFNPSESRSQFVQNTVVDMHIKDAKLTAENSTPQSFQPSFSRSSEKMQQMYLPYEPPAEIQTHLMPSGSQSETLPQGDWHHQPIRSQSQILNHAQHERVTQNEFQQHMIGQDDTQVSHFLMVDSAIPSINGNKEASVVLQQLKVPQNENPIRQQHYHNQCRWLLFLRHARWCPAPKGKCQEVNCMTVQQLWVHMRKCNNRDECMYPRCRKSKVLIDHYHNCKTVDCPVCIPVRQHIASKGKSTPRHLTGSDFTVNGSGKIINATDADKKVLTSAEQPEDIQSSLKRLKVEPSPILISDAGKSSVSVSPTIQPPTLKEAQVHGLQQIEPFGTSELEIADIKMESSLVSGVEHSFNLVRNNVSNSDGPLADNKSEVPGAHDGITKQETMKTEKHFEQSRLEPKREIGAFSTDSGSGGKLGKPTIKGVSLTELFTPEQIRDHITSLRQWVGQSKAKAEKNQAMEHSMSENSCQLCAVEKLTFEPPPIYCTTCGARIKRNAMYYTAGNSETRHYFCIPCYNEVRGDVIEVEGSSLPKTRLEKKKNDEETEEWWVQCDKCEAWQHQICALFNGRRNDGGQAEFTCPNCCIQEIERGERKPLPQNAVLGAKDLPRTLLSDYIEQRLFKRLKQERQERARQSGKSIDEVPCAEALVVRVVSSVDKKLEVKPRFLEIFQEENYATEFPYKSKVVLLFQKIEGVEVCLFGMYVQEFGSECLLPNQRRVYLSYLDSVKYFRPEIKTASGEALRTFVYHEILIGYLEYCKKRGFTSCYIWACPPLKGEDYILYCHPEIQKTPKSDKLREWYLAMLRKASIENIVVDVTNLYDHFFVNVGESKAKITAARLPYFDGDYWPGAAEDMINQLQQEEDGRKQQKKGKTKKTLTKRALKAAGHTDLSGNISKDTMLMRKLGETILPIKEDFIMVHLQHACTHCCLLMVTGIRWECSQCKNFQLCEMCYDLEQNREERDKHPINSREKHFLNPVEINGVPSDTKDKDEILESEFFDTRQAFLSLCQGNHYQYDTLRRAKHSSMMVLYHLHNPTAPAFVTSCNICQHDIETGQGWRCETCPEFDICNNCYQDGGVNHPHKLTNHPSTADAQNTEARQKRVLQLRKMLDLLVHTSQCRSPQCPYPNCRKVKGLFRHGRICKTRASGGCVLCKKMWYLLQLHARACKESDCHVPRCRDLKEHLRRLQQQSDSRRRAAVMEMMRQRAAEVAGNTG